MKKIVTSTWFITLVAGFFVFMIPFYIDVHAIGSTLTNVWANIWSGILYWLEVAFWTVMLILFLFAVLHSASSGGGAAYNGGNSEKQKRQTVVMAWQSGPGSILWKDGGELTHGISGDLVSFTSTRITFTKSGSTATHYYDTITGYGAMH